MKHVNSRNLASEFICKTSVTFYINNVILKRTSFRHINVFFLNQYSLLLLCYVSCFQLDVSPKRMCYNTRKAHICYWQAFSDNLIWAEIHQIRDTARSTDCSEQKLILFDSLKFLGSWSWERSAQIYLKCGKLKNVVKGRWWSRLLKSESDSLDTKS